GRGVGARLGARDRRRRDFRRRARAPANLRAVGRSSRGLREQRRRRSRIPLLSPPPASSLGRSGRLNSPLGTARMSALQRIGEGMARPTAGLGAGPQAAAGGEAPPMTLLNLFATPLVIATMPEAAALNAELRRIILAREATSESVQRSNHGGWQS